MNDRDKCMKTLQMYKFALSEAALFLDTHPDDPMALRYLKQYKEKYDKARADVVGQYGPLTTEDAAEMDAWAWGKNPWPWEVAQ